MDTLPRTFGPFLLLKSLGAGATGDVFLARPLDASQGWPTPVVVKRMHPTLSAQPEQYARFQHEARIALALSTPHVPQVHAVGEAEGTSFIAMDYVPGWTLSRVLKGRRKAKQPVSLGAVVAFMTGVLNGLIALHEAKNPETDEPLDALHRDLAPKNLMLGEDGVARIIDLGLGKSAVKEWQTSTGVVMGTPGYMAPEQVLAGATDVRTDLYTIGLVIWEMLAGSPFIERAAIHNMLRAQAHATYRSPPPRSDVSAELEALLRRVLATRREDRFASARVFLSAFEAATQGASSGEGIVSELVTSEMWDELAADREEVLDLTQALQVPAPVLAAKAEYERAIRSASQVNDDEKETGEAEPAIAPEPPRPRTVSVWSDVKDSGSAWAGRVPHEDALGRVPHEDALGQPREAGGAWAAEHDIDDPAADVTERGQAPEEPLGRAMVLDPSHGRRDLDLGAETEAFGVRPPSSARPGHEAPSADGEPAAFSEPAAFVEPAGPDAADLTEALYSPDARNSATRDDWDLDEDANGAGPEDASSEGTSPDGAGPARPATGADHISPDDVEVDASAIETEPWTRGPLPGAPTSPPPPRAPGRPLLAGLALASVGTVLGIGAVILVRIYSEEPLIEADSPRPTVIKHADAPKASAIAASPDELRKALLQRATRLKSRVARGERAAFERLLKEMRSTTEVTDARLQNWERTLTDLESKRR